MTKCVLQQEWYDFLECRREVNKLFVFGDNLRGLGTGGQANIRALRNAHGIPTKRTPSMDDNAFFSDQVDEYYAIKNSLDKLEDIKNSGCYEFIVFPADGLGTGLAKMKQKSPALFEYMNQQIFEKFGISF